MIINNQSDTNSKPRQALLVNKTISRAPINVQSELLEQCYFPIAKKSTSSTSVVPGDGFQRLRFNEVVFLPLFC